jgi:hypothetical protein
MYHMLLTVLFNEASEEGINNNPDNYLRWSVMSVTCMRSEAYQRGWTLFILHSHSKPLLRHASSALPTEEPYSFSVYNSS